MPNRYVIVGDKFAVFARNENVMTVSQFSAAIEARKVGPGTAILGQGVSESWVSHIIDQIEEVGVDIRMMSQDKRSRRASAMESHKRKRQNVLISAPRKTGDGGFSSRLLIDEECELMGDHQTGQHLQGMLLVEAARQMFLAVIHRYLRPGHDNYAVINYINATFVAFAFPLDTEVLLTVTSGIEPPAKRNAYVVAVRFCQCGEVVTTVETRFTVYDADHLGPKESGMASKRAADMLDLHRERELLLAE